MDTAVAIRTLEATYKSSSDATAVESTIQSLIEKVELLILFVLLITSNSCEVIMPFYFDIYAIVVRC